MSNDTVDPGFLQQFPLPALREIAKRHGVTAPGNRKDPLVAALVTALNRPGALDALWATLTPEARQVAGAATLLQAGGPAALHPLRELLETQDTRAAARLEPALDELSSSGYFVRTNYGALASPATLLYRLPPDEAFLPPAADSETLDPVAEASTADSFALLATRTLLALKAGTGRWHARPRPAAHALEQRVIQLKGWPYEPQELDVLAREPFPAQVVYSRNFTVPPASTLLDGEAQRALGDALGVDGVRFDFVVRLLATLELLHVLPGRAVEVVEDGLDAFLAIPPETRALHLMAAWLHLVTWTELDLAVTRDTALRLRRSGNSAMSQTYNQFLGRMANPRVLFYSMLRRAPAGQWVDCAMLSERVRTLRRYNAEFWPLGTVWFLERNGRKLTAGDPADWRDAYGAYLEALLAGPLQWQGLVEVAYRRNRLAAFRVTALGAQLFGHAAGGPAAATAPEHTAPGGVAFAADGDLLLSAGDVPAELLRMLVQLCEVGATGDAATARTPRKGGQAGGQARAGTIRFHPSAPGAARVFGAGWDAERVLDALERAAGTAPPESLARRLRTWWERFGAVQLYGDVTLLELNDDYALPELLASTSLAQVLLYRFSPRLVALRPEGLDALKDELVARGYTPQVVETAARRAAKNA